MSAQLIGGAVAIGVYGERQYAAEDPWAHQWTFSPTLANVDPGQSGGVLRE